MTSTPAGWYDDGHGALRWWDGAQWTQHVHVADAAPAVPSVPAVPAEPVVSATLVTEPTTEAAAPDPAAPQAPSVPTTAPDAQAPGVPPLPQVPGVPPVVQAPGLAPVAGQPLAPGGPYTGTAIQPGAPAKTGRAWVVPVILGAAFVLLVTLAIIFIPMIVNSFTTAQYSDSESDAVEAVEEYDEAWRTGDCELLEESTTESLRESLGTADCASFAAAAEGFQDSTDDYSLRVTDVTTEGDAITVRTYEEFTSYLDDDGNTVPGFDAYQEWDYTVIEVDDDWVVDDAVLVE